MSVNIQNELLISATATALSYAVGYTPKGQLLSDFTMNVAANVGGSFLGMNIGNSLSPVTNLSQGFVSSGDAASGIALAAYYKFVKNSNVQNSFKKGAILVASNSLGRIVLDKVLKQ